MNTFYLPESLKDLKNILLTHGETNLATYHVDKIAYIIHTLYSKRFTDRRYSKDSFIELNAEKLADVLGRDYYKRILTYLIDCSVIESDNYFVKGEKSYGFRLTKKYRLEKYKAVDNSDTAFMNKLAKEFVFKDNKKLYNALKINIESIEIDLRGAINKITETEENKEELREYIYINR